MRTPSEEPDRTVEGPSREWAARPARAARSIFGNYTAPEESTQDESPAAPANPFPGSGPLQAGIDSAMARAFIYRFLAQAFADPTEGNWAWLSATENRRSLQSAVRVLAGGAPALAEAADAWLARLEPKEFETFLESYLAAFGHAARGRCPLNEIEYGDIKADPLFQPHRLADLAAFYRAFGLEVADGADERQDHLCLELEFMCVLAAKEAYALEHQLEPGELPTCHDAQRRFLREHLGRWTPAFSRRLARLAGDSALGSLANLLQALIEAECERQGIPPGSEDLLLRPVDEAAESLCQSCGLANLPPGAAPTA